MEDQLIIIRAEFRSSKLALQKLNLAGLRIEIKSRLMGIKGDVPMQEHLEIEKNS